MASPQESESSQESASESEYSLDLAYSQEETIAAVQDFIAFATKMYLDENAYESPPDSGWPSITRDSIIMQHFGKTDEVVELLRHLPYPSNICKDPPEVMPALSFVPFHRKARVVGGSPTESAITLRGMTEGYDLYEDVPAHVVGLAKRKPIDHGVLLDTNLGVIYWIEAASEFKDLTPFPPAGMPDFDDDERMSPGERDWRQCDTVWTVPDFFATLKHNFKNLHFVPMSRRRVFDGWYGPDGPYQDMVEMVKGIYRAHGWPDLERYRKKECLKAIHIALRDNFPGEEDKVDDGLLEGDALEGDGLAG